MTPWRKYPGWLVVLTILCGSVIGYLAVLFMVLAIDWGLMSLDALLSAGRP